SLAIGCGGEIQQLCFIQRPGLGGYAIVFNQTGAASGTCGAAETAFLKDRMGDIYTMDKFREDQSQLGIRPGSLLTIIPADPTDPTSTDTIKRPTAASLALGDFDQLVPDANNTCVVKTLNAVTGEGGSSAGRGIQLTNVRFLTGSLYQGSQVEMDATYSLNACSRTYHGIGITPVVSCDTADANACNASGNP